MVDATSYELGPELTIIGSDENNGTTYTTFRPTEESRSKSPDAYIAYNVSLAEGVSVVPLSLDVSALRFGTGGGYYDVAWVGGDGTETTVASGLHAGDPKAAESPEITVSIAEAAGLGSTTGNCQLRLYVYSLSPQKSIGFANVRLHVKAGGVDAIGAATANGSQSEAYFDLAGRRTDRPAKGISIVRTTMPDGTTKSVKALAR